MAHDGCCEGQVGAVERELWRDVRDQTMGAVCHAQNTDSKENMDHSHRQWKWQILEWIPRLQHGGCIEENEMLSGGITEKGCRFQGREGAPSPGAGTLWSFLLFSSHSPSPTLISLPFFFLHFIIFLFVLFSVALGLHSCTQPFSSCSEWASHGGGLSC